MAIEFNKKAPVWGNPGTEPAPEEKQEGYAVKDKVPADYLNWQLHQTGACIEELQTKLSNENTERQAETAKKDLSNVDDEVFKNKVERTVTTGTPIVEAKSADGVSYIATADNVAELVNGMEIVIIPNTMSNSTAITLNVNKLGAIRIFRMEGEQSDATIYAPNDTGFLSPNIPCRLMYIERAYDPDYLDYVPAWIAADKPKTLANDIVGTVPIESGGTGATTADGALKNLGAISKKGGTVSGTIKPETPIVTNIGEEAVPFGSMYSKHVNIYSHPNKKAGEMSVHVTGTTERRGETVFSAGNELTEGVEGNARGRMRFYGTKQGYTDLISGNESAENHEILLPNGSGTLTLNGARITTGSYEGGGTSGSSNKNSLTFSFMPKIVFVSGNGAVGGTAVFVNPSEYAVVTIPGYNDAHNDYVQIRWDVNAKKLSWWADDNISQLNQSSMTYYYVAIG